MFDSKRKPLSRRTMLRGLGVALALPFLEAMRPSPASNNDPQIPRRMGVFYFGTGMNMHQFEPRDVGRDFTYSRILRPLEPFRSDMTVLSGTYLRYGGSHQGDYTFLTGANAFQNGRIHNTVSADQVAANHIGRETRFPSLQLSVRRGTGYGGPLRTLSWNPFGIPLAAESDPHILFRRLFVNDEQATTEQQRRSIRQHGSILDAVRTQTTQLQSRISQSDRHTLAEYLNSVREVEQQLQRDRTWLQTPRPTIVTTGMGDFSRSYDPETTPGFRYETYSRLMYDLIALAWQSDSTRIVTYVVRQELRGGVYPEFGVSKGYHALSHHNNDPRNLEELARVDTIYMDHWAYFLRRLQSMREADGRSLLDHTLLAFSSGMGMSHSRDRLPTAVFGGRALGVAHQGHLRLPNNTPLAGLWHTLLNRLGIPVGDHFQDSHGVIRALLT